MHTARLVGQFAVQMGRRQLEQAVAHFGDKATGAASAPGPAPTATSTSTADAAPPAPKPPDGSSSWRRGRTAMSPMPPWSCGRWWTVTPAASLAIPGLRQPVGVAGGAAPRRVCRRAELEEVRAHEAAAPPAPHHSPPGRAAARRRGQPSRRRDATGPAAVPRGGQPVWRGARTPDRCGELCRRGARRSSQRARGGPLFVRRETGLVAKALLRPGGLDRLLADPRRRVLVGTRRRRRGGDGDGAARRGGGGHARGRRRLLRGARGPGRGRRAGAARRPRWRGSRRRGAGASTSAPCPATARRRTSSRRRGSRRASSPCTATLP